jgi:hypothetical protein
MKCIGREQDARERARRRMPGRKGKKGGKNDGNAPGRQRGLIRLHPSLTASYQDSTPTAIIGTNSSWNPEKRR